MRYQPIRVFVFHQVSDIFNPDSMWKCDWTETQQFKRNILYLKREYEFISLKEAHNHLKNDVFRLKRYAVLTCDDGWASVLSIVPWLAEHKIPLTLFINPQYLDGKHYQERATEKFLTQDNLLYLISKYSEYISLASHGWTHFDVTKYDNEIFVESIEKSENKLSEFNNIIPFYAFPYGKYCMSNLEYLKQRGIFPVFVDDIENLNDGQRIHRKCIDGARFEKKNQF